MPSFTLSDTFKTPVPIGAKLGLLSFWADTCNTDSGRGRYVEELRSFLPVHGLGTCMASAEEEPLPQGQVDKVHHTSSLLSAFSELYEWVSVRCVRLFVAFFCASACTSPVCVGAGAQRLLQANPSLHSLAALQPRQLLMRPIADGCRLRGTSSISSSRTLCVKIMWVLNCTWHSRREWSRSI